MESSRKVIVCRDLGDLSQRVAEEFLSLASQAVAARDRFTVALGGGSTPRNLYSMLASTEFVNGIPWSKVYLFWGDERCVPPDHSDSNYRMAFESLISKVPVPAENIYRMEGEREPEEAATSYEKELKAFFKLSGTAFPRFDLILLGLGEDGHTASLFPGTDVVQERNRSVRSVYVEKLNSHRLTLTLPVLNCGTNVFFLVAGENKSVILRKVIRGGKGSRGLPARRVKPRTGKLVWFIDEAAASLCQELPQSI